MRKFGWLLLMPFLFSGCVSDRSSVSFSELTREFVLSVLAMSPVDATSVGYHEHDGVRLDEILDDYGELALDRQRAFYGDFQQRLQTAVDADRLSLEERPDYETISNKIELELLKLDTIQSYRHDPTLYVELIGSALFAPYVLEYAPKAERYGHIIARLGKVPALLEQAKANLVDSPETWNAVAREENEGNIALIDETLRADAPAELRDSYDRMAEKALATLNSFSEYLRDDLSGRTRGWRLGREIYARKFRCTLAANSTPEQVLADAEAALEAVRKEMFRIALPLHTKMYPARSERTDLNRIVSETLDKVAERHATPETYFAEAGRDLEEAREFVRAHGLLRLPERDNLRLIETPEFMRGIYSVGGFNSAPALEPHLGAFYWLTPIPKDWPAKRIESKLREYNYYGLKLLTIHEAMPGHYVQLEYANDIQPETRRLLRAVFGNGPYVEGWAVYVTEVMLDEGYLDRSPELRLTFLKQQLRMIANAILDVRLHTMGMTDEEAMELMIGQAFQEKEEADGKLRRAKLSSCQLPTYFVGWRDWGRLRRQYEEQEGADFRLAEFHERALKAGAVPVPVLARLLMGGVSAPETRTP